MLSPEVLRLEADRGPQGGGGRAEQGEALRREAPDGRGRSSVAGEGQRAKGKGQRAKGKRQTANKRRANFRGLVLGCIKANFCKKICV